MSLSIPHGPARAACVPRSPGSRRRKLLGTYPTAAEASRAALAAWDARYQESLANGIAETECKGVHSPRATRTSVGVTSKAATFPLPRGRKGEHKRVALERDRYYLTHRPRLEVTFLTPFRDCAHTYASTGAIFLSHAAWLHGRSQQSQAYATGRQVAVAEQRAMLLLIGGSLARPTSRSCRKKGVHSLWATRTSVGVTSKAATFPLPEEGNASTNAPHLSVTDILLLMVYVWK